MEGIELATEYEIAFGKQLPFNEWITYDYPQYKEMIKKALESGMEIPQAELELLFDTNVSIYDIVD